MSDVTPFVTVEIVARMFPFTPLENVRRRLPAVLDALRAEGLRDRDMVLTALATIRAEDESFVLADDRAFTPRALARALKAQEPQIRFHLERGDLAHARMSVNGSMAGAGRFRDAWDEGLRRIPEAATLRCGDAELPCPVRVTSSDRVHIPVRCFEALTARSHETPGRAIPVDTTVENGELWAWIRPLAANAGMDVAWDRERRVLTLLG